MDELRWILLIAGVLVIAGVYGLIRWQEARRQPPRAGRRSASEQDVDIEQAWSDLDSAVADHDPLEPAADDFEVIRITRDDAIAAKPQEQAALRPQPAADKEALADLEEKLVILNVAATDGRLFSGAGLVQVLEAVDMILGEHSIYHRVLETRGGRVALFSAADILQPGTLSPDRLEQIESPGVVLFLQLPGPYDGLAAFEQMLGAGKRIAELLDAKLLDERRCSLTNQAIEHIREELREYRRLAHLVAKKG